MCHQGGRWDAYAYFFTKFNSHFLNIFTGIAARWLVCHNCRRWAYVKYEVVSRARRKSILTSRISCPTEYRKIINKQIIGR